jgi:hypothetical protein
MSSPVEGDGKREDPSAYAPKWVRDSNREGGRENTTIDQRSGPLTSAFRYDLLERSTAYSSG